MPTRLIRPLLASLFIGLAVSCVTTTGSVNTSPWLKPSPRLQAQMEQQQQRLPWTHGAERLEMIQWFAAVGEPAYPMLLEMVLDPRPDVAGSALAALGATGDQRLVDVLRAVSLPTGAGSEDLGLERARTLLRLGDWSLLPELISGLRSDRLVTRALCARALDEATREDHGFDPRADYREREKAVIRWEFWWAERQADGFLPDAPVLDLGG